MEALVDSDRVISGALDRTALRTCNERKLDRQRRPSCDEHVLSIGVHRDST